MEQESAQICLVEYTNKRFYLGVLHGEEFTFCKAAIAKTNGANIKMNPSQNSFKLNTKDIQVIDKKYIVFCNDGKLLANRMVDSSFDETSINRRINAYLMNKQ